MSEQSTNRMVYKTLDAWRGFASLWVVMYHMALVLINRSPELRSNPLYAFSALGHLGVQLFFVISGFCIANAAIGSLSKDNCFSGFVKARLRRLFPPLWFALLLAALLSLCAAFLVQRGLLRGSLLGQQDLLHQGFFYFFGNLTLTAIFLQQPLLIVVCWTLCYEIYFYAIVSFFLPFRWRLGGSRGILNGLHLVTTGMLYILLFMPSLRRYPFDLWPQFGMGVLIYDLLQNRRERTPKIWAGLIGLLTLAFVVQRDYLIGAWPGSSRQTFAVSLAFAVALCGLHRYDNILIRKAPIRWMGALGVFSYSLYLTHVLTLGVTHQIWKFLLIPESWHYLSFAVAILLSLLIAWIFYDFCEKPFIRTAARPIAAPRPDAGAASMTAVSTDFIPHTKTETIHR